VTSGGILVALAHRFNVRSREDLATEGLCYLLQEYPEARDALVDALAADLIHQRIRSGITFDSQSRNPNDPWIVDVEGLVGEDVYISIEGKLGAPLQPSQPANYANRLVKGGCLLFVSPTWQLRGLRAELQKRASAQLTDGSASWHRDTTEIEWLPLAGSRRLALASWPALLRLIRNASGRMPVTLESDLFQLERLVATHEYELEPWTIEELRDGAAGFGFAKALATVRALCEIITEQTNVKFQPKWKPTGSWAVRPGEFYDWYGGEATLPEPVNATLAISFDPVNWGRRGCPLPFSLSFRSSSLAPEIADQRYLTYQQMLDRANELLADDLGTTKASGQSERWWVLPFPIRPGASGDEARAELTATAATLLAPLGISPGHAITPG
jgi:hypothetical protein